MSDFQGCHKRWCNKLFILLQIPGYCLPVKLGLNCVTSRPNSEDRISNDKARTHSSQRLTVHVYALVHKEGLARTMFTFGRCQHSLDVIVSIVYNALDETLKTSLMAPERNTMSHLEQTVAELCALRMNK